MILKMEKLSAFGLLSDKDAIIRELMRKQCVQVTSPESLADYRQLEELTGSCETDVYSLEQKLSRYAAALSGISLYAPKAGMFAKRPRVLYENLEDGEMQAKADSLCEEIERIIAESSRHRNDKNKQQFLKASLEPWTGCDLPLEVASTRTTTITRCLLPPKTDNQELDARAREAAPQSDLELVSADREQQYMIAISHKECEDDLWEVLKEFGASKAAFQGITGTAQDAVNACVQRIEEAEAKIAELEQSLRELGQDLFPLKYAYDALSVRIQRDRVSTDMRSTRETFCFTAWVPETMRDAAVKIMEEHGCYYLLQECGEDEEPPILLKNAKFVAPYESVIQMYSLPAYRGLDPGNFVSVFYFIFFGMMLSDAGFGLILFFGGLLMRKKMDLGPSAKKLVQVIQMGGLSAVIWGTIYGSWFGDLIPVIGNVFFHVQITVPQWIDPLEQAVLVMGMSMALGLVHILIGMGLKAYLLIKRKHPWEALFDVGFWYMVIIGLVVMLCGAVLAGTQSTLFVVSAWVAIAGAVGLILTQGRDKKNPVMRILSGIVSLYDITGYFSDVLSYSRILALGLATGVIAQVVNIMGTLAGGGIIGAIVMLLVFTVGSALNLGINTLGAYVHTARLQYVEFFGKFYEPGGKPFTPVMANTKYIMVTNKEEL